MLQRVKFIIVSRSRREFHRERCTNNPKSVYILYERKQLSRKETLRPRALCIHILYILYLVVGVEGSIYNEHLELLELSIVRQFLGEYRDCECGPRAGDTLQVFPSQLPLQLLAVARRRVVTGGECVCE